MSSADQTKSGFPRGSRHGPSFAAHRSGLSFHVGDWWRAYAVSPGGIFASELSGLRRVSLPDLSTLERIPAAVLALHKCCFA